MVNPNMPNIPGMGAMTDTLDFVKNMWGSMGIPGMNMPGMNVPGMVVPTLSVEEINKKITDLRAVESWLGLNMNMLRGTIQALEVQAATITTLQQMGETFTASMNAGVMPGSQSGAAAASGSRPAGSANGGGTQDAGREAEKLHAAPEPTGKDETDAASLTAPLVNAAAWWNMLQEQFQQAVGSAMAGEVPTAAAAAGTPQEKPKAKPKAAASSSASKRKASK